MSPYEELAALAEAALPRAEAGELEQVARALARFEELAARLPERPPADARPALERAQAAQERLRASLGGSLAAVREELDRVDRGRRAARTYGAPAGSTLDQRA